MNWLAFQTTLEIMSYVVAFLMWVVLVVLFGVYLHRDPPFDCPYSKVPERRRDVRA